MTAPSNALMRIVEQQPPALHAPNAAEARAKARNAYEQAHASGELTRICVAVVNYGVKQPEGALLWKFLRDSIGFECSFTALGALEVKVSIMGGESITVLSDINSAAAFYLAERWHDGEWQPARWPALLSEQITEADAAAEVDTIKANRQATTAFIRTHTAKY